MTLLDEDLVSEEIKLESRMMISFMLLIHLAKIAVTVVLIIACIFGGFLKDYMQDGELGDGILAIILATALLILLVFLLKKLILLSKDWFSNKVILRKEILLKKSIIKEQKTRSYRIFFQNPVLEKQHMDIASSRFEILQEGHTVIIAITKHSKKVLAVFPDGHEDKYL